MEQHAHCKPFHLQLLPESDVSCWNEGGVWNVAKGSRHLTMNTLLTSLII